MNRNIFRVAALIFAAFGVVVIYLTYVQVWRGQDLLNHPRNRRLQLLEESVTRGRILDREGAVLAETREAGTAQNAGTAQGNSATQGNGATQETVSAKARVYPLGEAASNITGYNSPKYGRWGLELSYNQELLGLAPSAAGDGLWALERAEPGQQGNDLVLTIDSRLQQKAYQLLGNRKGAVVALEPATGRVLALVSKPGYDPAKIEEEWDILRQHPDSPLLNRAAQGLYPPGSTLKVVTAAGVLAAKPETMNRTFDAPGYIEIEGRRIEDKQVQGTVSFVDAFARSSNFVFATLGLELGADAFTGTAHRFLLDTKLPLEVYTAAGQVPPPEDMSRLELGESAIGQGRLLVSPLHMAMAAAAVANGGQMMAPTLVEEVRSPTGRVVSKTRPRVLGRPVTAETAGLLKELMIAVINRGTGRAAALSGVQAAGKTGSAENPHGAPHAWFVGFAPADRPQVAVAVIIENGGAGGAEAAPVAREIMKGAIDETKTR